MKNTTGIGPIMAKLIRAINHIDSDEATELRLLYEVYQGNNNDGKDDLVGELNTLANEYYDSYPSIPDYCTELISLIDKSPTDENLMKKIAGLVSEIMNNNFHELPSEIRWRIEVMTKDILSHFADGEDGLDVIEDWVEEILGEMESRDEYRIYELVKGMSKLVSEDGEAS